MPNCDGVCILNTEKTLETVPQLDAEVPRQPTHTDWLSWAKF